MSELYFYDGRFVRSDEPVVMLGDRGYQFGDGVYDAWMVHDSKQFLRREHLDRLEKSCAAIGIAPCYSRTEVEAFTDALLERSGIARGVIYLQWTRGWQSPRSHAAAIHTASRSTPMEKTTLRAMLIHTAAVSGRCSA